MGWQAAYDIGQQPVSTDLLHERGALSMIALDGASCALCHQITDVGLGTPESFGGGYNITQDLVTFGPFDDPVEVGMETDSNYSPALTGTNWKTASSRSGLLAFYGEEKRPRPRWRCSSAQATGSQWTFAPRCRPTRRGRSGSTSGSLPRRGSTTFVAASRTRRFRRFVWTAAGTSAPSSLTKSSL